MKAEIQTQRELMFKALDLINQMQTFEALFSTVDNEYLKGVLKPLQLQYAQTMATLAGELASIGKTKMITAQQAREIRLSKPYIKDLEEVYSWIRKRATQGHDCTYYSEERFTDQQLSELAENGFVIKFTDDQTYIISW